jgi:hypothetical protein
MTKTNKTQHSSFWINDSSNVFDFDDDINVTEESAGLERIVKLATIRRAVTNFVRILTNDSSLEVKYSSGKDSYTDGKVVIISADDNTANFDPMVGLALHEGSHCLLSDFDFLRALHTDDMVFYRALHPTLRKMVRMNDITPDVMLGAEFSTMYKHNKDSIDTLRKYLHTLMNLIEDRRIDSYVYKNAPGYRPYYDAMYNKYFFNKDVEKNMRHNPEWRQPTVENYVNWLLMIISPHFDSTALPGLDKMVKILNLQNIRRFDSPKMPVHYNWAANSQDTISANVLGLAYTVPEAYDQVQFPALWTVANELMIEILRRAKFHAESQTEGGSGEGLDGLDIMDESDLDDMEGEGLPNYDIPQKRFNAQKAKKAMEKMKDVMDRKTKKKKLRRDEQEQITTMENAAADMTESNDPIYGKIPCLVTKKLTREIMRSDWFPFANRWSMDHNYNNDPNRNYGYKGFLAGLRMGSILANRLQVRNDPTITHFTRQAHGKIDRRILSQLGMDIENVFKRTTVDSYNPVLLYLSIDASGSMSGEKWTQVMTVATALAFASGKVRNMDVVITLRGNLSSGLPTVAVVYDSRVDSFVKAKTLFPHLHTAGSTPEGLCYPATLELMEECAKTHTTYFINFSDGEPGCGFRYNGRHIDYGGENAYKQTKGMVNRIRELGIRVMSYFITDGHYYSGSNSKTMFKDMYGQDAEFVDVRNVIQILKTLNKLLLIKE